MNSKFSSGRIFSSWIRSSNDTGNVQDNLVDWNGNGVYDESEPWVDINDNRGFDTGWSKDNSEGKKEVGTKDDYSFSDELKELIANIGLEYW